MSDEPQTVPCPDCGYLNRVGDAICGLCGHVPPRATESQEGAAAEKPGTAVFRRPPTEYALRTIADPAAIAAIAVDEVLVPPSIVPPLPSEIVRLRKTERWKGHVATVKNTARLIRHALLGFLVLGAICAFREGAFSVTASFTSWSMTDTAQVAAFCAILGLPIGFITGWHGGGAFRGLFVAGLLFSFEPLLISWLAGQGHFVPWTLTDLVVGLVAGFCVGLFIEIDR